MTELRTVQCCHNCVHCTFHQHDLDYVWPMCELRLDSDDKAMSVSPDNICDLYQSPSKLELK